MITATKKLRALVAPLIMLVGSGLCAALELIEQDELGNVNQLNVGSYKSNKTDDNSAFSDRVVIDQERTLANYSKLDIRVPAEIIYRGGRDAKIKISATQSVLDSLTYQVRGGRLLINSEGFGTNQRVKIELSGSQLEEVLLRGSQEARFSGIQSTRFELSMRGSADVSVRGTANNCKLDIRGANDLDMEKLRCKHVNIESQGSSDIVLTANASISGRVLGAGDLVVYGQPEKRQLKATGAFDVSYD